MKGGRTFSIALSVRGAIDELSGKPPGGESWFNDATTGKPLTNAEALTGLTCELQMRQLVEHHFKPALATALAHQIERFDIDTSEWTADAPTEQAWYWHWNGDRGSRPFPLSVLWSGTAKKCFVSMNLTMSGQAEWCDECGGFWKRMHEPRLPETIPKKGTRK
jgi:hypothetical protein